MIDPKFLKVLGILKRLKSADIGYFIEHLNDRCIDNICECVFNVINTDLRLSRVKKNQLKQHIKKNCCIKRIKSISNKNIPIFKCRQALKMEGKGLPLILASVIPFLTSLLARKNLTRHDDKTT